MDELTIHIQDDVPRCILLADDIISVDESKRGINAKLESCKEVSESKRV